jgi:hypothetical protein
MSELQVTEITLTAKCYCGGKLSVVNGEWECSDCFSSGLEDPGVEDSHTITYEVII